MPGFSPEHADRGAGEKWSPLVFCRSFRHLLLPKDSSDPPLRLGLPSTETWLSADFSCQAFPLPHRQTWGGNFFTMRPAVTPLHPPPPPPPLLSAQIFAASFGVVSAILWPVPDIPSVSFCLHLKPQWFLSWRVLHMQPVVQRKIMQICSMAYV